MRQGVPVQDHLVGSQGQHIVPSIRRKGRCWRVRCGGISAERGTSNRCVVAVSSHYTYDGTTFGDSRHSRKSINTTPAGVVVGGWDVQGHGRTHNDGFDLIHTKAGISLEHQGRQSGHVRCRHRGAIILAVGAARQAGAHAHARC